MDILNLGVAYRYDKDSHSDLIDIGGGRQIGMVNASSGLQSAVPALRVCGLHHQLKPYLCRPDKGIQYRDDEETKAIYRRIAANARTWSFNCHGIYSHKPTMKGSAFADVRLA